LFLLTATLPAAALAAPLPRANVNVEYRIVRRHVPVSVGPPPVAFKATETREGLVMHKLHGPETIEVLLGREMKGDFSAEFDIDIAGFGELGIRANGGSPMPYFGFRSSDGKHENYFHLDTLSGGWHPRNIRVQRQGGKVSAQVDRYEARNYNQPCALPGYVMFVMNDTSKFRIRRSYIQAD
jgi:hypothetical protein